MIFKYYPENEPPVQVDYHFKEIMEQAENSLLLKLKLTNAVSEGECPFVVHGLAGIQIENQSAKALRAIALKHMLQGGNALGIGYSEKPESIYNTLNCIFKYFLGYFLMDWVVW